MDESACVFLVSADNAMWLVLWPPGYERDGDAILTGNGQQVGTIGSRVKLAGGGYDQSQYRFLRTLLDRDIPTYCQGRNYWLATGVE